eukprot:TRINITY_DN12_c1_g1_i1.p1 TRINITY_DN12_c1_g1~~TRINITY_DN12_c1_g1_i1.p1  ORF type:complete len:1113 (+),score=578.41 TRINITY_DN12_c1_g1_i1:110-3448(+)
MNRLIIIVIALLISMVIASTQVYKDVGILKSYYESLAKQHHEANFEMVLRTRHAIHDVKRVQNSKRESENLEWFSEQYSNNNNEVKKVLIVVSSFEGISLTSGIGTAYSNLAKLLVSLGHEVHVLYHGDIPINFNEIVNKFASENVFIKVLPAFSTIPIDATPLVERSMRVYNYLKKQSINFDVIHFPEWEGVGYFSMIAKQDGLHFENSLFIVGLHGSTSWVAEGNRGVDLDSAHELEIDFIERRSAELADYVWTPNQYMFNWVLNKGWKIESSKTVMIPLPMGFKADEDKSTEIQQIDELVFFGRLEIRKGLVSFCDAIDYLSNEYPELDYIQITFLGVESDNIAGMPVDQYIALRASEWRFSWRIISDYDRTEALEFLSSGNKLAIMPSIVDNSPYTFLECLFKNIPFIASDLPSISNLFQHDLLQINTVPIKKIVSLANAIRDAIKNGIHSVRPIEQLINADELFTNFYNKLFTLNSNSNSNSNSNEQQQQPLVSICLTHYERPTLLLQAIESIEMQTYKNFELILVDDGSTSLEATTLLQHLETPFAVHGWKIIRQPNGYLGKARNTAAKAASGKYLYFLDDDNFAKENAIETYVRVAQNTKAQVVTAAHDIFESLESPTSETPVIRTWTPLGNSLVLGLFRNYFGDANFLVDREAFLNGNLFTEDRDIGAEDYEWHISATYNGLKYSIIPESLLWYRFHSSNQMIKVTSQIENKMRAMRSYVNNQISRTPSTSPIDIATRILSASVENPEKINATVTCGDLICDRSIGENCVVCPFDCSSQCQCPGVSPSCNGNGQCLFTFKDGLPVAYCSCAETIKCSDCSFNPGDNDNDETGAVFEQTLPDRAELKIKKETVLTVFFNELNKPITATCSRICLTNDGEILPPCFNPNVFAVESRRRADDEIRPVPFEKNSAFLLDIFDNGDNIRIRNYGDNGVTITWIYTPDEGLSRNLILRSFLGISPYVFDPTEGVDGAFVLATEGCDDEEIERDDDTYEITWNTCNLPSTQFQMFQVDVDITITEEPTETDKPTKKPTKNPTKQPTKNPTKEPTKNPTKEPTKNPTKQRTQDASPSTQFETIVITLSSATSLFAPFLTTLFVALVISLFSF